MKARSASISEQKAKLKDLEISLKQIEKETAQLEKARTEREALESQLQEVQTKQTEAKAENPLLKSEMDALKGRIDQLTETEGADCPLCGQPLSPEDRKRLIDELTAEGKQKGDRYRANQDLLKSVTDQVKELSESLTESDGIENRLREANRNLDQTQNQIAAIHKEIERWESEEIPRKKELETLLEKEDYAQEARKTLAEIDEELKQIGYDAAAHDVIRKQEQEQRSIEETHRKLEQAQAALQPLEREIGEITAQIEQTADRLSQQTREAEDAAAQAKSDEEMPDLVGAEQKMMDLKEQENQTRMALGAAQQNLAVLETLKQRRTELEAEKEEFDKQVVNHKVLERAFGKNGVPALLIEQALPQIESKANEILEKLTGGTTSFQFQTQQEYKSGNRDDLRETLEIVITDGAGARGYEMYSGGEAFRINFAIRLALSEVLAQRAGARLQTLVIDEGFGSQDQLSRQRLIEAINIIRSDFKKILVITHIESLKEAFPTRIEVTKTDEGSQISLE
ncbi:MAG: SbcC/MukB-like Walker B domain-containing protein [Anaerolineales bacterium]